MRPLALALLVACAACTTPKNPPPPKQTEVHWPPPAGWKKETLTFPLGFAPSLPYHGHEALRFAPGFFDANAEMYFTYTFAFILDDAPPFTAEGFAKDLRAYFQGLMSAVGKKPSPPELHAATLTADDPRRFHGTAQTVDAFGDGRKLELNVVGETLLCGDRRIILASLSPRPPTDPVWSTLADVRHALQCREL
jgi:hypothetical protein